MVPRTNIVGAKSCTRVKESGRTSVARDRFALVFLLRRPDQPADARSQFVKETEARSLEPNLGKAADIAEIVAVRALLIGRQADLYGDAAYVETSDLRCQQPIIRPRGGPADLQNLATLPLGAADHPHKSIGARL